MMASTARPFFSVESIRVDPVKECEFFSSLKMRNGTLKLARASRFAGLEAEIGSFIGERATGLRQVLDLGASIGSTTIDLAEFLRALGAAPHVKVRVGKGYEVEQPILANKTCAAGSTS
jgi:hypothetical protein